MIVYEAHAHRLPPVVPYVRQLWRRRKFAVRMARADLKAQHYDTVLGQLWAVLNPLLLAAVYYLIFGVILGTQKGNPVYLAMLLSGLFAFYYTRNSLQFGAKSIVGGGAMILNTAFPRALLPISSLIEALLTYLPMLAVYAVFHLVADYPVGIQLVALPVIVMIQTIFNLGLALLFAALNVYFRDTSSFLPYVTRIWLYLSPVLYSVKQVPADLKPVLAMNPLFPLLAAWHEVLVDGRFPSVGNLAYSLAWAIAVLLGGAWFFVSREREFAVRI